MGKKTRPKNEVAVTFGVLKIKLQDPACLYFYQF